MSTEDRDEREGMDARDDEALWTLLGRRQEPRQVSPYFARRVLREVSLAEEARAGGWQARLQRWLPPALLCRRTALWSGALSGACALGLVCLMQTPKLHLINFPSNRSSPERIAAQSMSEAAANGLDEEPHGPAADATMPVEENEVIADLDNILQREESRLWTDDTGSTARF